MMTPKRRLSTLIFVCLYIKKRTFEKHQNCGQMFSNRLSRLGQQHVIDFENASIIDKGTFRNRKTLEAWHTRVTPNAEKQFLSATWTIQHSF